MDKILTMNDTINVGKNKKVLVSDIVGIKGEIFKLIKNGMRFDDEVLKNAHIIKNISNTKVYSVVTSHKEENKKNYGKDSESLKNILKSLNTLENQSEETYNTTEEVKEKDSEVEE